MRLERRWWSQIGHRISGECFVGLGERPADEVRSRLIVRREDVAVGVQCDRHVGVSETLTDRLRRDPRRQHHRGRAVPQAVHTDRREAEVQ